MDGLTATRSKGRVHIKARLNSETKALVMKISEIADDLLPETEGHVAITTETEVALDPETTADVVKIPETEAMAKVVKMTDTENLRVIARKT